jgi:hypothetical protein
VDEGRKRVLLIAASILAARKLAQHDGAKGTISAIADAVQWAEVIMHYFPTGHDEKEKYLFKRRNVYTHKADFRPPAGEWFTGGITNIVQEYTETNWTSTQTHGWPDVLEKTVRGGLARYISAY